MKSKSIAKLAKKANARMRALEKRGIISPSYQSIQARLEMLGVRKTTAVGRRFSESGKFANKNEAAQFKAALKQFLGQGTSTVTGYKKYRSRILESAKSRYDFDELGITEDEYMSIWENLPDSEQDRIYGSDEVVEIVAATIRSQQGAKDEDIMSVGDIVEAIQNSRSYKGALKSLGLKPSDVTKSIGAL